MQLVLVGGLPGSGKSTLATRLSETLGWPVIRSDEVRKGMAGVPFVAPAPARFYRRAKLQAVYAEMLRQGGLALAREQSVILDATWNRSDARESARNLAGAASARVVELRCAAPLSVLAERLAKRTPDESYASDADVEVMHGMAFDPWPEAIEIDTRADPAQTLEVALSSVQGGLPG